MEGRLVTHIGKRKTQEDFGIVSPNYSISIVCDGVGGRPDGKVASSFIGKTVFQRLIDCNRKDWPIELSNIVIEANQDFKRFLVENNYSAKASTTLAVLLLFDDYGIAAHIGDSRIYQFKEDGSFVKTKDHSRVQELVDVGVIKSEEVRGHKLSNLVTKIISGDLLLKKTDIRITKFTINQNSNRFLLCTDGVIEAFSDEELCAICTSKEARSIDHCVTLINQGISTKSNDNSTFILIDKKGKKKSFYDKMKGIFK